MQRRPVQWVDVFEHFRSKLNPNTIVHIYKGKSSLLEVVHAGYHAILSDCARVYLDYLNVPWTKLYLDDPHEGIDLPEEQKLVLGGQSEMWGETVDGSDLLNTIWPRAAAYAERLWSPRQLNSTKCALPRLEYFRCLLLHRGIAAAPVTNKRARNAPPGPPEQGSCLI